MNHVSDGLEILGFYVFVSLYRMGFHIQSKVVTMLQRSLWD